MQIKQQLIRDLCDKAKITEESVDFENITHALKEVTDSYNQDFNREAKPFISIAFENMVKCDDTYSKGALYTQNGGEQVEEHVFTIPSIW